MRSPVCGRVLVEDGAVALCSASDSPAQGCDAWLNYRPILVPGMQASFLSFC